MKQLRDRRFPSLQGPGSRARWPFVSRATEKRLKRIILGEWEEYVGGSKGSRRGLKDGWPYSTMPPLPFVGN